MKISVKENSTDTLKLNFAMEMSSKLDSIVSNSQLNESDLRNYQFIQRNVKQLHQFSLSSKFQKLNYRDSCMADNMINYIDVYPKTKGLYFAHNWHVSRTKLEKYGLYPNKKTAGRFLDEIIKDRYCAIAQIAGQGSYNVFMYNRKEKRLLMGVKSYGKPKRYSIRRCFNSGEDIFALVSSLDFAPDKKHSLSTIGAVQGKIKKGSYATDNATYSHDMFDAFIYIENTSPTHLLQRR